MESVGVQVQQDDRHLRITLDRPERRNAYDIDMALAVTSAPLAPEAVWAWCDEKLPSFARPRYVRFVEALPKTPSQKIQKAGLWSSSRGAGVFDRQPALEVAQ